MDDPPRMGVGQGVQHGEQVFLELGEAAGWRFPQGAPAGELQRHPRGARGELPAGSPGGVGVDLAAVQHGDDVRVVEARSGPHLP